MTHRFFVPPGDIGPTEVTLPPDAARQIRTVLRMQPGAEIIVLNNAGQTYRLRLTEVGKSNVRGRIIEQNPARGEPAVAVTLYQAALKGQKFEWVLQKGTELGVSRFVPVVSRRAMVQDKRVLDKKSERWQRIIMEAAEQSNRGMLPMLEPAMPLDAALQHSRSASLRLMLWEEEENVSLKNMLAGSKPASVAVFVGPEGGFAAAEVESAVQTGCKLAGLGPRILRAETAAVAVCAAIFYEMGEWELLN
jgi:16S rRNA (uracil1498-N3)-methyltransferase